MKLESLNTKFDSSIHLPSDVPKTEPLGFCFILRDKRDLIFMRKVMKRINNGEKVDKNKIIKKIFDKHGEIFNEKSKN